MIMLIDAGNTFDNIKYAIQVNKIEHPSRNMYNYSHLTFDKVFKNTH